ncbi:SAVED domain-containing protein [Thalassomonas actiniarum]|uniref:SAVED domain-containing protein n=1 Tax=Thalassomonas actiniarum TaxID=485447 RepID=A0AAE9YXH6_9GAMM|nr:SAVED domain-containing protein [Thalassomonas actiniarum]WDE02377.1 SAVED domain-containing protein [Thalassomonas actiniarum]
MKKAISYFIEKAADWFFRKRSPALIVLRVGGSILLATLVGSWALTLVYKDAERSLELGYQSSSTAQLFFTIGFFVGIATIVWGAVWEYQRYRDESKRNAKKKTIVIEQRGLVDTSDSPLGEYVKRNCSWLVDTIVNDIRERIIDNVITRPDLALTKVSNLKISIAEKTSQSAASDITIAYGGVFPVPFSFYTGYLLDDESQITVYDWDRDKTDWRRLDGSDDEEKFMVERPSITGKSVVLAISVSYPVDRQAISSVFTNLPIHYLSLPSLDRNNHWSKEKQDRLSGEFFEYCKMLLGQGVEQIHLILASQNSIAFRFGQAYDKRNLPSISVYQYERQKPVRYPWCLKIPHEIGEGAVIAHTEFMYVA